jgi:hypothetical protein
MKGIITILFLIINLYIYSQTSIIEQHFSNVSPTGWSSTSNVWNFTKNESATGNYRNVYDGTTYSARFSSAANGNSIYIYIPINFKKDSIYTITFYTKRVCSVVINTNELPNQTTLLTNETFSNPSCLSNWNIWYQWSTTITSTYTGTGYFQIWTKTVYGGPTSIYLDDLSIYESSPVSLPIELLYFKGKSNLNYNKLSWETATETNNDYFTLFRSVDGVYFKNVFTLKGAGNSVNNLYYEVVDRDFENAINYYFLRQTDYDAKWKDSEIISIDNRSDNSPTLIKVTNLLGQEVNNEIGILLYHYSDGTIIKKIY